MREKRHRSLPLCRLLKSSTKSRLALSFFLGCNGLVLGVLGPWVELGDLLLAAMCADVDFRKNFDSAIQARLGDPIVGIPEIHPQMANVSFRFGATMGKADVGLATALDMVLGLDQSPSSD